MATSIYLRDDDDDDDDLSVWAAVWAPLLNSWLRMPFMWGAWW